MRTYVLLGKKYVLVALSGAAHGQAPTRPSISPSDFDRQHCYNWGGCVRFPHRRGPSPAADASGASLHAAGRASRRSGGDLVG